MKLLLFLLLSATLFSCNAKKPIATNSTETAQNKTALADPIQGQLKTAEKLKGFIQDKNYTEAILLFSKKQQEYISTLQQDKELFENWLMAWTLDDATYNRYVARITAGKGNFVFENKEWKIDER